MSARTLVHAINGGQSIQDFNTSKAWLSPAEKDTVIMWIRAWSAMDFPPTWKLVTEAANMIIQEKYSDVTLHVSDQWISHFIYANYLDLSTKWAWSHDKTCANTLNPTNVIKAMEVSRNSLRSLIQWAKKLSHKRSNFTCQPNSCSDNKAKPVGNFHNKGRYPVLCHPKVQKFSPWYCFNIYFTIWYPRWDSFFACTWFSTLWPLSLPPSLWAYS